MMNDAPFAGAPSGESLKQEKAAWYREILELEPGSKVFLPYSRLLAELGQFPEAIDALRAGLERHPEYTEARLFLIQLLHLTGKNGQCGAEVARLARLFCKYPDFWDAWSNLSVEEGEREDFSVSLGILGALIRDENVRLLDVLASGLQTIRDQVQPQPVSNGGASFTVSVGKADKPTPPAQPSPSVSVVMAEQPLPAVTSPPLEMDAPVNGKIASAPAEPSEPEEDSTDEKCSLRTRSMAEILAEQGDTRGAIEIYQELLGYASPEEAEEIQAVLETLQARLRSEEVSPVQVVSMSSASSTPKPIATRPQNGVVDLMEKLARRLEEKAQQ